MTRKVLFALSVAALTTFAVAATFKDRVFWGLRLNPYHTFETFNIAPVIVGLATFVILMTYKRGIVK